MSDKLFYGIANIFFLVAFIAVIKIQRLSLKYPFKNIKNHWLIKRLYNYGKRSYSICAGQFNFAIAFLFLLAVFTSVYKLGEVPYGLHVDEAGMAYDALSLAKYGVDRYLNPYPVYFINFGGGQSAMYTYLAAFFIKIFGYSVICVRLPAVLFRLITFGAIYYTIRRDYKDIPVKNLLFLLIFSVCPYFIMQSRWGLDCNLLVGFLTLSVCVLMSAVRHNSKILYLVSGISFGLSLYTYALSYIIIPFFLLLTFSYLILAKRMKMIHVLITVIPICVFSIPLIAMILVNMGIIAEYRGLFTIPKLHFYRGGEISLKNIPHNLYIILSLFSFDNPVIFGRQLLYNALSYFGTVYYFSVPLFVVGVVSSFKTCFRSIKNREYSIKIIFITWFLCVLACEFLIFAPNINKANAAFIPILFFIVEGIVIITKNAKMMIIGIVILYLLNFSLFFNYYFNQYNSDSRGLSFFATDFIDAIRYVKNLNSDKNIILYDLTSEPYIYILLENQVPPYKFRKNDIETIFNKCPQTYKFASAIEIESDSLHLYQSEKSDSVYIVSSSTHWEQWFKSKGYNNITYGNISVFNK